MKKVLAVGLVLLALLLGTFLVIELKNTRHGSCTQEAKICPDGSSVSREGPSCEFAACPTTGAASSKGYKNTTYVIEGTPVRLVDGRAETSVNLGSANKVATQFFGSETTGDLNADGKPDEALVITQTSGARGTLYYVVAALKKGNDYVGTNAILLGDRITPQSTEIRSEGRIIVNYATRKVGEPMSTTSSLGLSKYITLQGDVLVETANTTGLGKRCGGSMRNAPVCDAGLHCAPVPGSRQRFTEVGGTCVVN